jgi:predicted RND superfamily exporter protein
MSVNVVIPSSPDDRAKIQAALKEISAAMTRAEAEKDYINESLAMLQDQFELPKRYMRKVARVYHKQNINEVKSEFSDIEDIYMAVVL